MLRGKVTKSEGTVKGNSHRTLKKIWARLGYAAAGSQTGQVNTKWCRLTLLPFKLKGLHRTNRSSLSSKTRYSEATEKFLSRMMLNQILSSKAIGINLKAKWNYSAYYYRATTTVTPSHSTNRKQTAPFSWYLHFVKQCLYISLTTVHQQGWTNSLRQHGQTVHLSSKLLKRFEKFSTCFYLSSNSFWTQIDPFNWLLCKKCLLSPETSQAFLFHDEPLHPFFFYAPNTLVFGPQTSFPILNVPKKLVCCQVG